MMWGEPKGGAMNELLTISYRSVAWLHDPVADVRSILGESHARNARHDVTGLLLFDGTYFLQTIEGPTDNTSSIFLKIVSDKRHVDVVPFGVGRINERVFPDWRMKL